MAQKKKAPEQQASITFQTSQSLKEKLEKFALSLGLTRLVRNIDGEFEERGNTSMLVNLLIRFTFDNLEIFKKWVASQIDKAKE